MDHSVYGDIDETGISESDELERPTRRTHRLGLSNLKKQPKTSEAAAIPHEQLASDFFAVVRMFGAFNRDQACRSSVSVPQCLILQELLNGEKEVSTLAGFAGTSTSAMSRLLDGLERNDFIVRAHDTRDRRCVLVRLTDTGRREARALHRDALSYIAYLISLLPRDEVPPIERSLAQLREAMDRAAQQGVTCSELNESCSDPSLKQ
jgi:DNA-binding MarR family transcriptional regulator